MNLSVTRIAGGLLVASIAAGGGIALTSLAQAQTTSPAPPMPPHHPPMGDWGHGEHGGPDMHNHRMMRDVERLKTSLKLNAAQTALWDKAQAPMKPSGDPRAEMKARRDRMAAMLDDPDFDPRKLAAEMDSAQNEHRARMSSVRDAWFAVYDSLDPVQRGQAREFLRSHMAPPHGMGGPMEGWKNGPDADAGRPPMPH